MDTLIQFGGPLKALGSGKFSGPLILFGDPDTADLTQEFFTKDTDFWRQFPSLAPALYDHGLDGTMKKTRIAGGTVELKATDAGIWMEGQLNTADQYEAAIYSLIEQGKLGASSGSMAHLVEKEAIEENGRTKAVWLKSWPIGEASLTPTPCEPRIKIATLKSLASLPSLKSLMLGQDIEEEMTISALSRLNNRLYYWVIYDLIYDPSLSGAEKAQKVREAITEYGDIAARTIEALLNAGDASALKEAGVQLKSLWSERVPFAGTLVREGKSFSEHLDTVSAAVSDCVDEQRRINALRVKQGRVYSQSRLSRLQEMRDELDDLISEGLPQEADAEETLDDTSEAKTVDWKTFTRDRFDFDREMAGALS